MRGRRLILPAIVALAASPVRGASLADVDFPVYVPGTAPAEIMIWTAGKCDGDERCRLNAHIGFVPDEDGYRLTIEEYRDDGKFRPPVCGTNWNGGFQYPCTLFARTPKGVPLWRFYESKRSGEWERIFARRGDTIIDIALLGSGESARGRAVTKRFRLKDLTQMVDSLHRMSEEEAERFSRYPQEASPRPARR